MDRLNSSVEESKKMSQVEQSFWELKIEIGVVEEKLEVLSSRLSPVVQQNPPSASKSVGNDRVQPFSVDLAIYISDQSCRIRNITERLTSLLQRLEL